jgi:type II secretory pathway component PulJ
MNVRSSRGLTMIEVVISLGLLVFIGTITWQTISGSLMLREILEYEDGITRSARVAVGQIKKELRVAFLSKNINSPNTYQTVFVGKDSGDEDSIWFATLAHRRKYVGSREGDQAEITLWVEKGNKETEQVLFHREAGRIDHEPEKDGAIAPMITHVKQFNLRYLDNKTNEWLEEWDSTGAEQTNRLPRAVEVLIVIEKEHPESGDEQEFTFLNTIILELAKPLTKSLLAGDGGGRKLPL